MSSVTWSPYVWPNLCPATLKEIHEIEALWGVSLPEDYKKVATIYQGCTPRPNGIKVLDGTTGVGVLLTVSANSTMPEESVQWAYDFLREHIPLGLYPFARNIGSNYFCFDYRQTPRNPRIVFIYPEGEGEDAILFVADNFTQFLNSLKD
jgi:hypothetical protein